jgi:hypothetical protein
MDEIIKVCRICEKEFPVSFVKREKHGTVVYNQVGTSNTFGLEKRMRGKTCHDCKRGLMRIRKGHQHRNLSINPQTKTAVDSEKAAERRFSDLGFKVKRTEHTGPDLICSMGLFTWTVEVKRAFKHNKNRNSWRVQHVTPNRKKDDLLAIVLPNGYVYIDSMENHLKNCKSHGFRTVTPIVKEFGLTPLPTT